MNERIKQIGLPALNSWLERRGPATSSVLLVLLAGWLSAELVWRVADTWSFKPGMPPAEALAGADSNSSGSIDLARVAATHMFGAADPAEVQAASTINAPETRLNLKLRGILSATEADFSRAIIASGSLEKVYAVGSSVPGGAVVHSVLADRVILDRRGQLETLTLPRQSADITPEIREESSVDSRSSGNDFTDIRDDLASNPGALSDLVRMQPVMENGQMVGVKIWPLQQRERFAAAGLRPGDLVTAVNGMSLTDPASMAEVLQGIQSLDSLSLTLRRGEQEENITLNADR
ncbi:MAG: type II secretion system protein GspC [Gammaproteobacteria bacterium]|nr:type II secretion system protein GspC [Gammaproteobacteria bacterium]